LITAKDHAYVHISIGFGWERSLQWSVLDFCSLWLYSCSGIDFLRALVWIFIVIITLYCIVWYSKMLYDYVDLIVNLLCFLIKHYTCLCFWIRSTYTFWIRCVPVSDTRQCRILTRHQHLYFVLLWLWKLNNSITVGWILMDFEGFRNVWLFL
jgi:hypothetical protein